MSYLGLDIGTSDCKAFIFNETGKEISSAYREYPIISLHEGWAELDSEEVCSNCFEVFCEAAQKCENDPVQAMGISSQGDAFTPVDEKGNFLGNGMVSPDTRAASLVDEFCSGFGGEKLYHITGHTAYPMFTLFKLIWIKKHQPELWQKASKFYCYEDLLHFKLGLDPAIGYPLAGRTILFNVIDHKWDDEILDSIGLNASQLARPVPSGSIVGIISPEVAAKLGLQQGVIVVTGGHDQTCGALGAGIVQERMAMYATGTVECITPAFKKPVFSNDLFKNNYCTYDFTVQGMYSTVAYSLTGGNILKWYRDEFAQREMDIARETGENIYELLLKSIPPRPIKLLVMPYFTPTGTPYFDSEISGDILGLRFSTSREEIMRALLEGVAFEIRLNLDILEKSGIYINVLRVKGGGAKSRVWTQLKADVRNKPITTVTVNEAGCFGVAMLARAAVTEISLDQIVSECVKTSGTVYPNEENAKFYEVQFQKYLKIYPNIKHIYSNNN